MKRILLSLIALLFSVQISYAQAPTRLCITTNGNNCIEIQRSFPFPVTQLGGTPIIGVGTGSTGAVVGTLAAAVGKTTFICGFDVSALGGTATVGPIVIAGLLGGSFTYQFSSSASGSTLSRTFEPCIQASATNTAITITTTADGTATAVNVNSWGYQQ